MLCDNPLQYPLFLHGVIPLYLSMASAYMRLVDGIVGRSNTSISSSGWSAEWVQQLPFQFRFTNSCNAAVEATLKELAAQRVLVQYNPGRGRFGWPPPPYNGSKLRRYLVYSI